MGAGVKFGGEIDFQVINIQIMGLWDLAIFGYIQLNNNYLNIARLYSKSYFWHLKCRTRTKPKFELFNFLFHTVFLGKHGLCRAIPNDMMFSKCVILCILYWKELSYRRK